MALANRINKRVARKRTVLVSDDALGIEVGADGQRGPFTIDPDSRLKHVYVLGSTGSGKTNLLAQLIAEDLERERTTAILDLRGDLVDRVLNCAAGKIPTERLHLIDLRRPEISGGINPFRYGDDPYGAALQIHSILRSGAESWGVQLDETLRCSLIALSHGRCALTDITQFLTDVGFRSGIVRKTPDAYVTSFFERFEKLTNDKQTAWTLPVLNKVSAFLSHPSIRSILSEKMPIDLPAVLDTPGSVLLVALGADRLHGLSGTFGCLTVSSIENSAMRRVDQAEESRNPVHLYLDEFENFQSSAFEAIIAEGRRFRLGLTLSHQNLHQLDPRLRHVVMNNAATRIYFRTGQIDASELGRELAFFGVRDGAKSLLHLPTGQAYVLDGSQKARRIQFRQAKTVGPRSKDVEAVRQALGERFRSVPAVPNNGDEVPGVTHVKKPRAAKKGRE